YVGSYDGKLYAFALRPFASIAVSTPTSVGKGAAFTVTATAKDASGHTVAGYNGPASWSDLSGALSPSAPSAFVDGVSTTTTSKVSTPFHADRVTVSSAGVSGQSGAFDVVGPFAAVQVAVATPVLAGVPFTVTATATDAAGNTVTGYSHAASWSSLDGTLSPATPNAFVHGVSSTVATVAAAFDNDRVTVAGGSVSGESGLFDVVGPASVTVQTDRPVRAGEPFTVTAVARDAAGHVLAAFDAPAAWSSLDGGLSPATPAAFVHGVSSTSATVGGAFRGDRITVSGGGVSGRSGAFKVFGPLASCSLSLHGPVSVADASAFGAPLAVAAGAQVQVRAVARDAAGNPLSSYNGPASWSSLDGHLSPASPASFLNGVSDTPATISVPYRGDRITITSGGATGQSGLFTVAGPLAAIRVRVTTPVTHGQPFQVRAVTTDTLGTPVVKYTGTAAWSSLDGGLTPAAPASFVNGVSTTMATIP